MDATQTAKARTDNASLRKFEQLFAGQLNFQISEQSAERQARLQIILTMWSLAVRELIAALEAALAAAGEVQS